MISKQRGECVGRQDSLQLRAFSHGALKSVFAIKLVVEINIVKRMSVTSIVLSVGFGGGRKEYLENRKRLFQNIDIYSNPLL